MDRPLGMEPIQVIEFSKSEQLFRLLQQIYAPSASPSRVVALGILRRILDLEAALPDLPAKDVVSILVPSCPVEGCGLPLGCSLPTCTIDGKTTIHTHTIDMSAPPKLIWAQGLTRSGSAHERFDLLQVGGDMIATAWLGDHGWRWIIVGTMTGDGVGADSYREAMDAVQEALGLLGSDKSEQGNPISIVTEDPEYRMAMTSAAVLVCHGSKESEESTPVEPVFARHPIGDTGWFLCVEGFTTSSGRFAATGAPFVVEIGGINEGSRVLVGSNLIVSLDSFDVPDNVRRALHGRSLPTWGCATVDWPVGGWPHPSP